MNFRLTIIIVLLAALMHAPAYGETIVLKNGEIIERAITFRDEERIKVDSGYGIDVTYFLEEVATIDGIVLEEEKVFVPDPEPVPEPEPEPEPEPKQKPVPEPVVIPAPPEVKKSKPVDIPAPKPDPVEEVSPPTPEQEEAIVLPSIKVVDAPPIKDLAAIEKLSKEKEASSPFGPRVHEKEFPVSPKMAEPLPTAKIMAPAQEMAPVSPSIPVAAKNVGGGIDNLRDMLYNIPVDVRQDVLALLCIVILIGLSFICFPLFLIARKLNRKHAWLALIPVVQLFYAVYMVRKPFWLNVLHFIPAVNVLFLVILMGLIIQQLKKPIWLIFIFFIPVLNIGLLWYLALSKNPGTDQG